MCHEHPCSYGACGLLTGALVRSRILLHVYVQGSHRPRHQGALDSGDLDHLEASSYLALIRLVE